jgi:sn-glycerol 3-phosphate transport system permease protein
VASLKKLFKILEIGILVLMVFVFMFPFLWMCSTSLKTLREAYQIPPSLFPSHLMFSNYIKAWQTIPFALYLKNSLVVTLSVVAIQFLILVPAAYGFARYNFKGKQVMFSIVLLAFMLPSQITFVPVYLMFSKLGMVNSYAPLIIPFAANAFGIFLLRQYFMQIPEEIIEAARLDDATQIKIIMRIMIPMAKPALATIALLSFISHWNSYFWPLVMTNSDTFRTLPIGIAMLRQTEGVTQWQVVMAANVILIAPIIFLYILANQQIKKAFVYSGIK